MIITATDIGTTLHDLLREAAADRVFVLCDENTRQHCWQPLSNSSFRNPHLINIPAGDDNKNISTLETV